MLLIGTLFVLLASIAGLASLSYGKIKNARLRDMLHQNGHAAEAEVTMCSTRLDGIIVGYAFSVDGISYSGHARMKLRRNSVLRPGGQISIRYLPEDPRDNLPINVEVFLARDMQPFLLLLSFMGLCVFVIYTYLRERRLVHLGVVVEARVTGCAPYHKQFEINYEFTTVDNVPIEGSCITDYEREVGNSISIIYLRSNPKRSERYPIRGVLIVGGPGAGAEK